MRSSQVILAFLIAAGAAVSPCAPAQMALANEPVLVAMGKTPANPTVDEAAISINKLTDTSSVTSSKTAPAEDTRTASDITRELYDNYMRENNLTEGYSKALDKSFYFASAPVGAKTSQADFGKMRVFAYEQAYQDALKSYIKSIQNDLATEAASSLFSDNSKLTEPSDAELSKGASPLEALANKAVALGDAVISKRLKELGVDPAQYNAAPPDKKKVLLMEAFSKTIFERAFKVLGGVTPLQTFIGDNGKGDQAVGVLIMYSPKLEAIATDLARGQKPKVAKQGPPLTELVPINENAKLYDLLGVRVAFDEYGPVVISYGQWSSSYDGTDERQKEQYRKVAFGIAESQANAQIAEFLQTNFTSTDMTDLGNLSERAQVTRGADGTVQDMPTDALIERRSEHAKRKSAARLQGVSTLKRWVYKTPEGHDMVGVVKTYSFANMEAAKSMSKPAATAGGKAAPGGTGKAAGRKSVDQMNINDF